MARASLVKIPASTYQKYLSRYARSRKGQSLEDLAKEDNVTLATIQNSVRTIERMRMLHGVDFVNEGIGGVVLDVMDDTKDAIKRGLNAKKEQYDFRKKEWTVLDDVDQQTKAVAEVRQLAGVIQKKEGAKISLSQGTQVGVAAGAAAPTPSGFVSMEETLRRIRTELDGHRQLAEAPMIVAPPEEGEEDIAPESR